MEEGSWGQLLVPSASRVFWEGRRGDANQELLDVKLPVALHILSVFP